MLKQQNPLREENRTLHLAVQDLSHDAWASVCAAFISAGDTTTQVSLMKFLVGSEVRL